MPSVSRGVLFLLCLLVTVFVLCSSAATLDAEEKQKEERARDSGWTGVRGGAAALAPNPPEDLSVFPMSDSSVLLQWNPPSNDTDPDHYFVYVEGEDRQDETDEKKYTWTGLEACKDYSFGVRSVSATEDMSDPLLGEGKTLEDVPPAPQNLQVDSYTTTTVTLTWDKPDTLCTIEVYRVKWSEDSVTTHSDITNEASYTATGLSQNTHYIFRVSAFTSFGEGPVATVNQTTAVLDSGSPEDLLAEGISSSVIIVTWSHPASPPDFYKLTAPPCLYTEENVFGLSYSITGLEPCQSCTITVTSVYGDDDSTYRASTLGTSLSGAPPPPEICSVGVTPDQVTVSWEKPTTYCILGPYSVNWTQTKLWGDREETTDSDMTTATKVHVTDPVPYSQYSFEVSASADGVFGSPASCSGTSLETLPGSPEITTVYSSGQGEVLVSWEGPAEENGVIVSYGIFVDEETDPRKEVNGDVFSASVKLNSCSNYSLWMMARNGAGWGPSSEAKDVFVVDDELPDEVKCTAADLSVEVCWMPYSESCPVSQYNLEWEGDVLWSEELVDSNSTTMEWISTQTCYPISALPYTKYHVTLTVGIKTDTRTCSDITPMAAPGPPAFVNLTTKNLTVNVAWTEPEKKNGIIEIYKVEWTYSNNSVDSYETEDNSTFSFDVPDVSCGETVDVTLMAKVETVTEFGEKSSPQTVLLANSVKTLNCESTEPGKILLDWTLMDTECSVTFYNLTWTYDSLWSDDTGKGWRVAEKDATSSIITSLPPYSLVSLQVHVDNSLEYTECTAITPEEAPGPPVILAVDMIQSDVLVSWETPTEENGIIINYGIFFNEELYPVTQVNGDMHNASVELEPCKNVGVSVRARNGAGWGLRSEVENVTDGDSGSPVSCFVTTEESVITVTWEVSFLRAYDLSWTWKKLWGDEEDGSSRVNTTALSYSIDNPVPYSNYTFEVSYCPGIPASCSTISLESPASAPTAVVQVAMGINSVTVQWSLPEFMRGRLLGWYLRWTSAIGQYLGEQNITNPEARVFQIGDLEPSEVYSVFVMAVNGAGKGEAAFLEASTEYVP